MTGRNLYSKDVARTNTLKQIDDLISRTRTINANILNTMYLCTKYAYDDQMNIWFLHADDTASSNIVP